MLNRIHNLIQEHYNEEQSIKMTAYMKDMVRFAGIPKPKLLKLIAPFLKEIAKAPLDWQLVRDLWNEEYREAQYIALEYIKKHHKELRPDNLEDLRFLIVNKSWWETVDTIDAFVGEIVAQDAKLKSIMLTWANDDNIWIRRVAIDFQQEYKLDTDTDLLEKIIRKNMGSDEFFINKAIGWSLRDYSKVNPDWVRNFIKENRDGLAALTIKEASKYL